MIPDKQKMATVAICGEGQPIELRPVGAPPREPRRPTPLEVLAATWDRYEKAYRYLGGEKV